MATPRRSILVDQEMEFCAIPFLLFFLLPNLLVLRASSARNKNDFLECIIFQFQDSNTTISDLIYTPENASYSLLMQSDNLRLTETTNHKPLLIITPFQESQIQDAIYCSKKHGLQILIRSGGHDYEGLSYNSEDPFFVVDMRNFRSILIDDEDNTAWVEAGATLGQLYYAVAEKSRTLGVTAGSCPTVGVGGHFSGGGYSMMSRRHGLAIDHIIDAKVMNADGIVLDRKSMGEDHFWAIRGGGGTSFGIVLAFKVNLIVVPETVTVFNISRTSEQNVTQLVHKWQYIADKIDDNLLIRIFMKSLGSLTDGKRTIQAIFASLFLGRVNDLLPIMQEKFPELGLMEQDCIEMSWIESTLFFAYLYNQSLDVLLSRTPPSSKHYYKGKSDFVRHPISEDGLKGILDFLNEEDENCGKLQLSPYGGRLNDFSESETPFPHRSGNIFMIQQLVGWKETGNSEMQRHLRWIRRLYSYMAPYVSSSPRTAYFNYRDLDIGMNNKSGDISYAQASIWGYKYFKRNFNRLVRIKTKVDPSNFFRNEQSIPPLTYADINAIVGTEEIY